MNQIYYSEYFTNNNCISDLNHSDCTTNYNQSKVKSFIDFWVSNHFNDEDLVSIDGYKARLLNVDDLLSYLGYSPSNVITDSYYEVNDDVPKWMYNDKYSYWTMSSYNDLNKLMYTIQKNGNTVANTHYIDNTYYSFYYGGMVYGKNAIRPVINLNKCVLDGGCTIEEIEFEDGCTIEEIEFEDGCLEDDEYFNVEDEISVVDVPNTLSFISKILLTISLILIISGSSYIIYNYYNSRKERK